jgi:hypothetical protein
MLGCVHRIYLNICIYIFRYNENHVKKQFDVYRVTKQMNKSNFKNLEEIKRI